MSAAWFSNGRRRTQGAGGAVARAASVRALATSVQALLRAARRLACGVAVSFAAAVPAYAQLAACPTGAPVVDNSGTFAALGPHEGLAIRGGATGSADWEFGLGADTSGSADSVRGHLNWTSGRAYPYVLTIAPDGTGRLTVVNLLTLAVDLGYRSVNRPLGLGNALRFQVASDAGIGTNRRIRLTVATINATAVNATLQTAGNNAASAQQLVYASTALSSGAVVTGTITLTFSGSVPAASALRGFIAAGNIACDGAAVPKVARLVPETLAMQTGASAPLTVVLDRAAAADTAVRLTTTNSAIASVPASVTVPAGARQANAVVTAGATAGRAGIVADVNGSLAGAQITVLDSAAQIARIDPPSVNVGVGATTEAQAVLDRVPAQEATVALRVEPPTLAAVPGSVVIAPGERGRPFAVAAGEAGSGVVAAAAGAGAQANLAVSAALPVVAGIEPATLSLAAGATANLKISLSSAQPADVTVPLASSAPALLSLPASVVIPAGRVSQTVAVTALAAGSAEVQAMLNGPTRVAAVNVVAAPAVAAADPNPLVIQSGATVPLQIKLNAVAATDTLVTLSSGDLLRAAVPARALVLAGEDSARVMVAGLATGSTNIYASAGGAGVAIPVSVVAGAPGLAAFAPASLSLARGQGGLLRVRLDRVASDPATVTLASSVPAIVGVAASVTIPAGALAADVPLAALAQGTSTISATLGTGAQQVTVQVGPAVVVGVSLSKTALSLAAGSSDAVSLRAHYSDGSQQDATAQATWTSSAGTVATVTAGTVTGVAQGSATVSATYTVEGTPYTAGTAVTVTEPVLPLALAGNATIAFGGSATFTVSRPAPAPRDIVVTLTPGGNVIVVPPSVVMARGHSSAAFTVTGSAVGSGVLVASAENHTAASVPVSVVPLGPTITAISPTQGPAQTTVVTISGTDFGANPSDNTVSFAGAEVNGAPARAPAVVLAASSTQLTVRVPAAAVTGAVQVSTALGTALGPVFTVTQEQAVDFSASPASVVVYQGASSTLALSLASTGPVDYTGLMQLSVSGLPAGVSARFAPTHLARGQNGTLTLTAAAAAPVTEVPITLTATNVSGGLVAARTATVRVSVQAAAGVTGVKGRFVTPEGAGLAAFRVAVQDAGGNLLAQTVSDAAGNFLLTGLTPGSITLRLDGTAANPLYPIWPYTFVHPGNSVITLADWVIAPPPADDKFTPIANAAQDQIVTDARFPGLEITLPAGVTITGYDGVVKTRIAVERMTPDKLPTPPPPIRTESIYQLYFGTPMGGIPSAPIPVKVPNDLGLEPGETTELWYFDGVPMGGSGEWKVGGTGTVSADGKYIVTNPGEGIPRFCGVCGLFCFADNQDRAPNPPCDDCEPGAPNQGEGNPITLATGQALATATDLVLDGDPPIVISRRFNPFDAFGFVANYTQSLGVNWTFNYDVALMPFNDGGSSIRMVMPGNRRFNFAHSGGGEYRASTGPLMMQGHRFRRVGGTSPTAGGTPVPLLVSPAAGSATAGISALAPADVDNCFFSSSAGNYELKQKNGEVWTFSPFPAATPVRINGGCLYFLTEIRDARGRTLTIQRGANGALARITSSSGRWVQFFYSNGVVSSLQDSLGRTVTYTHVHLTETGSANGVGGFGGLRQSIGVSGGAGVSAGVIAIRDDARVALRRLASATTPDGTYAYTYEDDPPEFRLGGPRFIAAGGGTGALFSAAANVGTGTVDACPMSLSGARIASLTRPDLPGAVVNSYGPSGRVHRQTWPDGTVRHFRYELLGACVYHTATPTQRCLGAACPKEDSAATAAAGWRFVGGRVVATTVADAVGELYTQRFNSNRVAIEYIDALGQSWKYERDANNRIVRSVDPLGRVTRYTNDENGNRTRIVDAANRVTEITYTLTGLPKPATVRRYRADGTSVFWQFGFDAATGNLTSARDPVGNITTLSYAATTHLLRSVRSAGGRTTSFEHDSRGELVRLTDPLGRDLGYEYDGAGRNTKVINGLGQETAFAYNARDQLTAITDAHGGVTQFAYDANNRLQSVTDPLNQTLERYGYTAASRLSSVLDGFNRETRYSYDARGLVSELLDRQGQRIVFERDIAGRITRVSRPDADTTYRYDAVGRLIEIAEGANRLTVDYDVLDRPVRELHQQGDLQVTIEHDWDDLDRRSQRRLSAVGPAGSLPAQTTDYAYDDAGRITRITQQGQLATYVWDADHRLTDKTLPNGVAVRYTYDAAGQVTEIAYRRTDGTLIERIAYQYDAAGRRVQKDTLVAPSVDETPFAATYDAGNRLSSITLAPGTPAAATYTLSYDPNGNLIEKRNSADATDLTTYTWDSRNRLVALSAPGLAAAFVYDALGRRTERRITRAGEPELVTQFVYDGLQAVGEIQPQRGAVPERNDALITGLLLDEVIARVSSGANGTDPQARTYLTDALGSVLLQLRGDQTVQSTTGYSPYGQSSTAGDAAGNRIEFTGRENDATGLLFYRARYYDPVLKRFISEDPIGLAAGTHLYGYVDGNPVLYTDPTGNVPFVAPIAWGYVRCLAQCTAWSAAGSLLDDGGLACFDTAQALADCALDCLNPINWGGKGAKAGIGGESDWTKRGREAHKNYRDALGDKYRYDRPLPSGKRPDAIDWTNREVRELKPDNQRAIERGERQLEGYVRELERITGEKWTGHLDTYKR